MGGYGLSIELVNGPIDPEILGKLHREVWAVVARRLWTLVTDPDLEGVLTNYMYVWVDDELESGYEEELVGGFEDEDWFASPTELMFSYNDQAGFCRGEMYAALHWTGLVLLEQWPAVEAVAAAFGAQALPPVHHTTSASIALHESLTGPATQIFFVYSRGLAYASYSEHSGGWLINPIPQSIERDIPLDGLPEPDRSRVAALVGAGRCDCQPCRTLRTDRGLDQ